MVNEMKRAIEALLGNGMRTYPDTEQLKHLLKSLEGLTVQNVKDIDDGSSSKSGESARKISRSKA